jgi:hypothetical protein
MKKSLSETGVFIGTELIEQASSSVYWNQHKALYVIVSSDNSTKAALLQVKLTNATTER